MSSEGLHIAIKDAMKQMGDDIIASPLFVNILSDLSAFKDYPACKTIMKDLQKSGEFQKAYDAYKKKGKSCASDIDVIRKGAQKKGYFKKSFVDYVFDCLLYAFNLINAVSEPEGNSYDPYVKRGSILDTLDEQLNDLKNEYRSVLDKAIVLPKDLLRDPAGYYSVDAMNELYLIEAKYQVVADALGNNELDWCKTQLKNKLSKHKQEKENACKSELTRLKRNYESVLLRAKPNTDHYKVKPTDLDKNSILELSKIESKIKEMYAESGITYNNWCEEEKQKRLDLFLREYIDACQTRLTKLKSKYQNCLTYAQPNTTDDRVKPTCVDSKTEGELSKIETEIRACYHDMGMTYDDWCAKCLRKKITEFEEDYKKKSASVLQKLKDDYAYKLENEALNKRSGGLISRSALYRSDVLEELKPIERTIKELYSILGQRYDNFCENKRDEIFNKYQVSPQKRRKQIFTRIVLPLIIALLPISWGVQYLMYKDDIAKFNQQMAAANGLVDQGNLSSALLAYEKARDDYDHDFLGKKYEADHAIEDLVSKICNEANDLISQNKYSAAKAKLNEIPKEIISGKEELEKKVSEVQAKLTNAIASIKDLLISNISKNGGKLDADGKKMLEEALLVSPDDYWLNFIKGKEK